MTAIGKHLRQLSDENVLAYKQFMSLAGKRCSQISAALDFMNICVRTATSLLCRILPIKDNTSVNEKSQQKPLAVKKENPKRNLRADQLMDNQVMLL